MLDPPMYRYILFQKTSRAMSYRYNLLGTNIIPEVPERAALFTRPLRGIPFQLRNRARVSYMRKQPDITTSMRCILGDWLVEVSEEYKLHRETLCLSINYIDRFLSQMSVLRGKLQLVGTAAMFLAA